MESAWALRTLFSTRVAVQNSSMLQDVLRTPVRRPPATLLPPGVETDRFHPDTPDRLQLRRKLGLPPGAVVVGSVANLVAVKGHPVLIDAIARVPGCYLWLAGKELDARYAEGLRRQIAQLGIGDRVFFLGSIADVPALLAELDVTVLASKNEGCPVALLEAMAGGRACIATRIPGPLDVVDDGRNGRLVPYGDAVALAGAIRDLTSSAQLRREMGAAARRASSITTRSTGRSGPTKSCTRRRSRARPTAMRPWQPGP